MGDEEGPRCIVSDPAQPHNLSRRAGLNMSQDCFACGIKTMFKENRMSSRDSLLRRTIERRGFHYYCTICNLEFHKRCLEFPSKMIHPYHPQHPLTFTFLNYETRAISNAKLADFDRFLLRSGFKMSEYLKTIDSKSNIIFDKCTWCGNDLGKWFYRCSTCNFSLDFPCAQNIPPLTIQNPKSHHHSLALFLRPLSFPCDACGLINVVEPSYACHQCSYVVHHTCIDLPRVIKITRHPHRLSHTPYLPTKISSCRVCYKNVDIKYGQYSCSNEDCSYVVHSKCATHEKIWNGEELEWEPEESNQTEDIAPFKKVGDLIQHFCHHHYLKLENYNGIRDSEKQCQACIRPISSHDFYTCIECDYFLHEVCANLPRKLDHALHKHPLFMDPHYEDYFHLNCSACSRLSNGYKYKCREKECNITIKFQLDINFILVPECFTHKSHEDHLLFISTSYNADDEVLCQGCKGSVRGYHLHCIQCEFAICYKCATIPDEIYYKYDEHPLSLCHGESGGEAVYWCEVCEKRLHPTEWFYTNKESCVTIHRECLFGDNAYMMSGHRFTFFCNMVEVVSNGSSSRPLCHTCHRHSPDPVSFKVYKRDATEVDICSFSCFKGITL